MAAREAIDANDQRVVVILQRVYDAGRFESEIRTVIANVILHQVVDRCELV